MGYQQVLAYLYSGSWTRGQVPQKSQFNSDENRCNSPGAEGRRRSGQALGGSVLDAVKSLSHIPVSCTMSFKLGMILPTHRMV